MMLKVRKKSKLGENEQIITSYLSVCDDETQIRSSRGLGTVASDRSVARRGKIKEHVHGKRTIIIATTCARRSGSRQKKETRLDSSSVT